ncbi:MAG TPA: flagellar motor protein MotB [Candidatus Didemnitutus sp.]|nr:flagellar motor protein MotB [Candidatus Didemnitutus sp.]
MGGGAWKVAYADFVTAMMALFMVLWISAQDKKILIATSRYFQSPFSSPMSDHSGIMPFNKESNNNSSPKSDEQSGKEKPDDSSKQIQLSFLNSVAADFYRLLHLDENLDQKPIDVQVTSDGLRITLFDRAKRPLFVGDTTEFSESGRFLMQTLAWLIERHHFRVTIDGHTRSNIPTREDYSAWELSADRANAARRSLVHYAVDPDQIERVTGYADTRPLHGEKPDSESNQRITLSLTLTSKTTDEKRKAASQAATTATPVPAPSR